jgi:REP element-mobilizing transposase RayT
LRYFITFPCYGADPHCNDPLAVDPSHNLPGSPFVEMDPQRARAERELMAQAPYLLDADSRAVVLEALSKVCINRGWILLAAHVRSTHVHVIIEGEVRPEMIMNAFKAYASRRLNHQGRVGQGQKRWARHGSTRWLWTDVDVRQSIQYVVEEQGEPMVVFLSEWGA